MNRPVDLANTQSTEGDDEIDLHDIWRTFSPWKWRVLLLASLVAAVVWVIVNSMTPLYPAVTTLMVESQQAKAVKIEQVYDLEPNGSEYFGTQFAIVRSREIARRVAAQLSLINDTYFWNPTPSLKARVLGWVLPQEESASPTDEQKLDAVAGRLQGLLFVEPVRGTQLVNIRIEHPDPRVAARITDAVANAYIENQMEVQLGITRNAADWLGSRLYDLKRKLELSEQELQKFLESNNLVDLAGVQTVPADELQALSGQLAAKRSEVNTLSRRYGDKYPKLVAAREELALIEGEYNAKLREIQAIGRKEARLRQLKRNVELNRSLYDTFLQRVNETAETGKWEAPVARIIDRGVISGGPSKPRKGLIVAIAFLLTFVLGTLTVFVAAFFDRGIKTPQQLRDMGLAPLGVLPLLLKVGGEKNGYAQALNLNDRPFAEAVKTLRTNIILDDVLGHRQALAVTSTMPGEGKTTTALCLARSLAELETVLLIDADLRRPSLHRALALPPGQPGLSQLVAKLAQFDDCVVKISDNLHALPAGIVPPNPSELLSSPQFAQLLTELRARGYGRIVIDTPPLGAVSDALVIGRLVDGVVCVVHADRTHRDAVADSTQRLRERGSHIVGAVLNQVEQSLLARHQYQYYGYYGQYDGYTVDEKH